MTQDTPPETDAALYDNLRWKLLRRLPATDHKIFSLAHHESIHPITAETHRFVVVDCPHWVNVIALTATDDVVLIRQFRHGTSSITLEIPGGMVDPGEAPLAAAQRELHEETGYHATTWCEIGVVEPNPAFQTNRCWTFLALDATRDTDTAFDPEEVIQTELHPLASIDALIESGEIAHSLVIAGFFHLLRKAGGWQRPGK